MKTRRLRELSPSGEDPPRRTSGFPAPRFLGAWVAPGKGFSALQA